MPLNSTLTIHKQTVMIHPIIDEFYSHDPSHSRSSRFAQAKGQTVTRPDKTIVSQPMTREGSGCITPNSTPGDTSDGIERETLETLSGNIARLEMNGGREITA